MAEPDGTLWSADARGGVVRISPDGKQQIITQQRSGHFQGVSSEASRYLEGTLPNGLAFARNGDILISNFGTDCLELMTRDGAIVLADSIDGEPIGKVNFVLRDSQERIWITVSTRIKNWMHALRTDLPDGYIARYIDGKFRIVADGFHFTNEIRMDAREEFMYVVETTGGCVSRLRVGKDGSLSSREVFGPSSLGRGAWPDGIAFDSLGNLWGTMVRVPTRMTCRRDVVGGETFSVTNRVSGSGGSGSKTISSSSTVMLPQRLRRECGRDGGPRGRSASAIWWRQLVPLAARSVPGEAARIFGNTPSSPIFSDIS